ncbi:hypothetical protein [Pseudomonas sp. JAI115]|uniref:hypothetical protein n=1 Tax=Pseudomonas sp. JAI115 TaxID=2723061 RepID=UPI0021A61E46|nr:hypothetical protein [Pseudomonas sp. JAI115]
MLDTVDVNLHRKRDTDFDLVRVIKAQTQGFEEPVTAYLCRAFIKARTGVGAVFGHNRIDQYGRLDDGHLIQTSDVIKAERQGRFWVLTTVNSRYVLVTFQRGNGCASLRQFLRLFSIQHHSSPHLLQ